MWQAAAIHLIEGEPRRAPGAGARELRRADAALRAATVLQPSLAEAWFQLGVVRVETDDQAGAGAAFQMAAQLSPRMARMVSQLMAVQGQSQPYTQP